MARRSSATGITYSTEQLRIRALTDRGSHPKRVPLRFKGILGACLAATTILLATVPIASALPAQFFGLNGNSGYQGSEEDWKAIQESGIKLFRMELNLGVVSHNGTLEASKYDWSQYDTTFRLAAERGITILPYLYRRANGSEQFPTETEWKDSAPGSWFYWVYLAVHRYGYSGDFWAANPTVPYKPVSAWEVWNEPNLKKNNPGGSTVQPENYARFLKRIAGAIQEAQKERSGGGTQVLFGGLFSAATVKEGSNYKSMNVNDFLEKAHNVSETGTAFNGLSLHPYSFAEGVSGVETNVKFAREKLNKWFSSSKTLWITELGWPIEGAGQPSVNETQQAELLSGSFNWIKAESSNLNIQYLAWFDYRDINGNSWDFHTGLLNVGGGRRPSWCTYEDIIQVNFCNPYPVVWSNDNLGGYAADNPTISSWESGRLDAFVRGGDNALWHNARTSGGGWTGWQYVGGVLTSGPDAVSWGKNRIDIVARTTGNSVYHVYWDGSAWGSDNLGGYITADPTITSWESGRLDAFVRGGENALWHNAFVPGSGWTGWQYVGGVLASGPDAVSWGPNRIDIVYRATDNSVYHVYWNGSTWNSDDLGGYIVGDPTISSSESGRLDVFARGGDNALWHKWFTPSTGWSEWSSLYGLVTSSPDAVSWGKNRFDVVALAAFGNNSVMHAWWGE